MATETPNQYEDVLTWCRQRSDSAKRDFLSRFGTMQCVDEQNVSASSSCSSNKVSMLSKCPIITQLLPECLEHVFKQLPFDTVAKIRPVCQYFNKVASSLLNSEFSRLRINMHQRFQSIKAQMPRRESARRRHPLARESDIIETLHMRLTLLQMTFGKHIERHHCCFFAGEILDEVYRILHHIKVNSSLNRAYKVTDELFDLSTMAMEYFKEHIEPSLPEITYFSTDFLEYNNGIPSSPHVKMPALEESASYSSASTSKTSASESTPSYPSSNPVISKKFRKMRENIKRHGNQVTSLKRELKVVRKNVTYQQKQLSILKEQQQDYNKKMQCTTHKLNLILQELNHCKMELQYWRSHSPAGEFSSGKITPVVEHNVANDNVEELVEPNVANDNVQELVEPNVANDNVQELVEPNVADDNIEEELLFQRNVANGNIEEQQLFEHDIADYNIEKEFKPINCEPESIPSCSQYHVCCNEEIPPAPVELQCNSEGQCSKMCSISMKRKLDVEDMDLDFCAKKFIMNPNDDTLQSNSRLKNEDLLVVGDNSAEESVINENIEHEK